MPSALRVELESLLRARRLDRTLNANPWADATCDLAATGLDALDEMLGGGISRGHLSEVVGAAAQARPLRQFPYATWMRVARVIEGSRTAAVVIAAERLARSPGGVTIALEPAADVSHARWRGLSDRARFLGGIELHTRV